SLFRTAEGHDLLLAVGTDRQFAHLCTVLGLDGLPDDPRFATNAARVVHRDALGALLRDAILPHERDALLAALHDRHVPAGAVLALPDVFDGPDADARVLRHDGLAAVRHVAFTMDGVISRSLSPPPAYAADTVAVLQERLGLTPERIAQHRAARALDVGHVP
ncbi:MAG: CoA transferase, partial [Bacteroidota bacterium]